MATGFIYHICPKSSWEAAVARGVYSGGEMDRRDGFIHFSGADQVRNTAARYLSGVTGLVLIKIDPDCLGGTLKWEKSSDNMLFPHVYGTIDPADVAFAADLPVGEDGLHVFPDLD
tara:strand:- start:224 stop:571 length:348 start_codon:yes stop_codon:yes gene_type:complete